MTAKTIKIHGIQKTQIDLDGWDDTPVLRPVTDNPCNTIDACLAWAADYLRLQPYDRNYPIIRKEPTP